MKPEAIQKIISRGDFRGCFARPMVAIDLIMVKNFLVAQGLNFNEEYFKRIVENMARDQPSVYYLLIIQGKKLLGLCSFFTELKLTRGGSYAGHVGDLILDKNIMNPKKKLILQKKITHVLTQISQAQRPEIYKTNLHLFPEFKQDLADIKYKPEERHMTNYNKAYNAPRPKL